MQSGSLVAGFGSSEHCLYVKPLESRRKESDCGQFTGSTADPIPHGKSSEPLVLDGLLVQFAAHLGDGDAVTTEVESGPVVSGFGFEHPVAGLFGPAGFGDDDTESFAQTGIDGGEHPVHAVGVRIIEGEKAKLIGRISQSMGNE